MQGKQLVARRFGWRFEMIAAGRTKTREMLNADSGFRDISPQSCLRETPSPNAMIRLFHSHANQAKPATFGDIFHGANRLARFVLQ
jgi:hypothetical protein